MKILIVDDSKTARYQLITVLRELGYADFYSCENIEEAKKTLSQEYIDLIISDWHMPQGSGLELLKYVRATPALSKTNFLMLTVEQHKPNILEAVKHGVQGYFFKPIHKEQLKIKLDELTANSPKKP